MIYQSHYNLNADIYQQSHSHHHAAISLSPPRSCLQADIQQLQIAEDRRGGLQKIRVRYTTIFLAENKLRQME